MKCRLSFVVCFAWVSLAAALAAWGEVTWPMRTLLSVPETYDASAYATNAVRTVFYRGLDFQGKPTRVFAYYGVPEHPAGTKVPAMVLVHGGGGSAFVRWVKFWNAQGYAAISMDTCGCVSGNVRGDEQRGHVRHAWAGPKGWGGFDTLDRPVADQWMYHAVADVVLAHSFLAAQEGVDAARIGLTGVSWGGVISSIVGGVDRRFAFIAPVYGCGGVCDFPGIAWTNHPPAVLAKWRNLWDPIVHLPKSKTPTFWLDGTNDRHFTLPAIEASRAALPSDEKGAALRVRMSHAHSAVSEQAAELVALADHYLKGGAPLPRLGSVTVTGNVATASVTASKGRPAVAACLDYTRDDVTSDGQWFGRFWRSVPARLANGVVTAEIPPGTRAFYLNVETPDRARTSSAVISVDR